MGNPGAEKSEDELYAGKPTNLRIRTAIAKQAAMATAVMTMPSAASVRIWRTTRC